MKFLSFVRRGQPGFGVVSGDGVIDLTGRLDPQVRSLRKAIELGVLDRAEALIARGPGLRMSDLTLLPVIPDPDKILCIGLNYESHRAETRRLDNAYPTLFARYADSQIAHGQHLLRPRVSDRLDYEGELAVIIGKGGRYIPAQEAMAHVAGYACYNDGTVRDWQRHTHQFMPGKTFPGTGAFGPVMVDAAAIPDYRKLRIVTQVNSETVQDATLDQLIFPIEELIAYCSSFTPLQPGDVILTGTPGGVGDRRDPPCYLQPGDVVSVEIAGVGHLVNPVAAES
ncbi:fumarylacetoacetate hydrolase family protein [Mesorhizobium sp. DCY119]|uniref:fumarylacetoacetate hydrolase family protein n=1 Tax=Mesorhizobium sp. DCY119 TaxID=2108445 RepID=UPI000E71CE38|nr:fumarylacetoacetate hydrolase family protein [Mesorhizobium sp. DCY119]RJG40589.1 FAA hydrolase family protein [Mesorhizobium sp. DCY119]